MTATIHYLPTAYRADAGPCTQYLAGQNCGTTDGTQPTSQGPRCGDHMPASHTKTCTRCNRRQEFIAELHRPVEDQARAAGWRTGVNGHGTTDVWCPVCTGRGETA
jgi:hypothetical protein